MEPIECTGCDKLDEDWCEHEDMPCREVERCTYQWEALLDEIMQGVR